MRLLEFVIIQFVVLYYLYLLIKNHRKPIDNYSELILVRGIVLVVAFSIANVWLFIDNISPVLLFWESIKGLFVNLL